MFQKNRNRNVSRFFAFLKFFNSQFAGVIQVQLQTQKTGRSARMRMGVVESKGIVKSLVLSKG